LASTSAAIIFSENYSAGAQFCAKAGVARMSHARIVNSRNISFLRKKELKIAASLD
jgi:hypothetical protein